MSTDSLTEAVAAMEAAWRRLREVLDGPDVAAALVALQAGPRPMSTAPRDGTWVWLHINMGNGVAVFKLQSRCARGQAWDSSLGDIKYAGAAIQSSNIIGWTPVK
jgi:hypothetical protein